MTEVCRGWKHKRLEEESVIETVILRVIDGHTSTHYSASGKVPHQEVVES